MKLIITDPNEGTKSRGYYSVEIIENGTVDVEANIAPHIVKEFAEDFSDPATYRQIGEVLDRLDIEEVEGP